MYLFTFAVHQACALFFRNQFFFQGDYKTDYKVQACLLPLKKRKTLYQQYNFITVVFKFYVVFSQ